MTIDMTMDFDLNLLKNALNKLELDYYNLMCQARMRRVLTTEINDIKHMAEKIQKIPFHR